ncbi:succinyl-CoA synthetase beta subunit [Acrasis kona]|uniref:Succinate--CoA ligase [ADP-forming] subunit beta, mitochondrial n=1 Tax=Acrasis kona TaxID=1008807 RepID=A0AAW2Z3U9_9EUKA
MFRSTLKTTSLARSTLGGFQKRFLNLHEYQSQQLFAQNGIAVPKGIVASTPEEAQKAAESIEKDNAGGDFIIKAQVLAGGRGLGHFTNGFQGGVHKAYKATDVRNLAEKMLGQVLITKQTGTKGKPCNKVFIQERVYARREYYFAILLDRASSSAVMIGSSRGGMAIEDVAKESPEDIFKEIVDYKTGLQSSQVENLAKNMGFSGKAYTEAVEQMTKLYKLFSESDATMIEINPMIETPQSHVLCADAKVNIDDNADYKQDKLFDLRDVTQEDARDIRASKAGLNYIGLDGNIGCIVNGAGLAMATMDIIKLYGGSPANFLDVGGGATQGQISEALKILNEDKQVTAILVNIFGGIARCDMIALGLISAVTEISLSTPLVVRLQGTNVDKAKDILEKSGIRVIPADNLDDAAEKAVRVANIVQEAQKMKMKVSFELPI